MIADFPNLPLAINEAMRERFPALHPTTTTTLREYDKQLGIEEVLQFLANQLTKQTQKRNVL